MRPPPSVHRLVHGASPALNRNLALPPAVATRCFAVMIAHRPAVGGIPSGPERRLIHSSHRKSSTLPAELPPGPALPPPQPTLEPSRAPLSLLPLSMILRSLGTTLVSSSPLLLAPSLRIMAVLAHSASALLNPDRNPLLRFFIKRTFYAQFCAGEDGAEVRDTIARLKGIGFNGVILGYAKEVVLTDKQAGQLEGAKLGEETQTIIDNEIVPWAEGTLETVRLAEPGDFVALK